MGRRVLLAVAASLLLTACGGGGDSPGPLSSPPAPLTGVLVDSPVQGLSYTTDPSGLSGRTGPKGEFQYQPGDHITFPGLLIGATTQPTITPFTLLARTSVPDVRHEWPVNLAQLLLALDTSPGTDVLTMPATLPAIPQTTCLACPNFDAEMAAAGIPLVSEADAIAHLKKQYAIWGSWTTVASPSELRVFTFLPDGTYVLAHDDDPAVAGGNDGIERGTYQWDPNTHILTYKVEVNTDGTGGLSNPGQAQTPPYTFVIDGTGNAAVLHFGPNPADEIHLTRVASPTDLLVGGWKLEVPSDLGFTAVLTLLPNGTFTVASDAIDTVPAGVERGTYTFDATTGTLTMVTTVDTNGEFGINDPAAPGASVAHVEISQAFGWDLDFLRLDDGTGLVIFDRVKVP